MIAPDPCPFCGGPGSLAPALRDGCRDGEADAWASSVVCRQCAAEGPWKKADNAATANERAIRAWNRRVEVTQ